MDDNRKAAGLEILKVGGILVIVAVVISVAASNYFARDTALRLPARTSYSEPAPPRYTLYMFNQIRTGMDTKQVVDIVQSAGELVSQNELAGIDTRAYSFVNDGGSNMMIMFQNGRVVSKSQFGLR